MKANDFEGRRNISGERVRMRYPTLRLSQAALDATADASGLSPPSLPQLPRSSTEDDDLPGLSLPILDD